MRYYKYIKMFLLFLFLLTICSCIRSNNKLSVDLSKEENNPTEIKFEIAAPEDEKDIFPDGKILWISIEDPEIDNLYNKDEIVLQVSEAYLIIDYPLTNTAEFKIVPPNENGFTRKDLIRIISEKYHDVYRIEEETAKTKTIPLSERKGLINRNQTDGKYGIWGHDLADLDLSSIQIETEKDGKVILILNIES